MLWKHGFLIIFLSIVFCAQETNAAGPEHGPICRHIQHQQDMATCHDEAVWKVLAKQRVDDEALPSRHITLFVGGDPIQRAGQLWETGFVPPGRDVAPWPFTLPVDWNADPFQDRNWRFHLHAWRMIDPMIVAWERTGDKRYLQDALKVMTDWQDYHFGRNRRSAFQWYDMSVGLRAMKLAYVLDRVLQGEVASDLPTWQTLVHLAHTHAQSLTDPTELSRGNHGLFQLHGLMALCSILPDVDTCQGHEKYVLREMRDLLLRQFSSEGVHLEGAPEYHFFALSTVRRMTRTGWYDQFAFVRELMDKVEKNRFWMVHPDGTMVTVGDSEPKRGCTNNCVTGDL
ncbi:hypothetical protein Nhal_0400 [Nitrosococcus halophilus Nc 4]|uniref:Heparin-sulfate lyase N-terminal domain-containing protein n=1 Tax=Nitrosococcus halophilus (strain Nc4) TaxID=472759 RepID=D5BVG2_NITHN|nr:heparinase II/III family protein [Nitrosococcus halophilus]ADE13590.1 hypothetical protein Nhal_0400 [Nitrosococcus halophilus Nc 4]